MIYEYRCDKCDNVSEFQMKLSDPHPTECPQCQSKNSLERIISRTSFTLKGTGWYSTDYKSPTKSSSAVTTEKSDTKTVEGCGAPQCGTGACAATKAEA